MNDATAINKSKVSSGVEPPRWMLKAEKAAFQHIVMVRNAAQNPVLESEIDLLSDYVGARSRLAILRKFLRREMAEEGVSQRDVTALIRQIDTSTSLNRRLARELGLAPSAAGGGNE